MNRTLIIALLFSLILVVFALQNAQVVDLDLYFWHYESSLAIVVLISFGIGAIVGILFSLPGHFKRIRELKDLKNQVDVKNREISSIKASQQKDQDHPQKAPE